MVGRGKLGGSMVLAATGLIVLGGVSALMGLRLVRTLLPILGFVAGLGVGFGGVQSIFGTGVISLAISIVMALIVAVIMAVLSYLFYEMGIVILAAVVGATALSYLGIAIGLEDNGVVLFLMGLAGAIMAFVWATSRPISGDVTVAVTSLIGTLLVLSGVMVLVGEISLDQLNDTGIIRTTLSVVDQAFLWFIAWFGGSMIAANVQSKTAAMSQQV